MSLNYQELNALAQKIETINRWRKPYDGSYVKRAGKVEKIPKVIRGEGTEPEVYRSEIGVTLNVTSYISGDWISTWVLDLDPDNMPETEEDFWRYLDAHLFIRLDSPENTVPPPSDPLSSMLYLPTVLRATWMTAVCPYVIGDLK